MLPVPRQSRAESPEVVLLAVEDQMNDQATWGLRLHGLPSSLCFPICGMGSYSSYLKNFCACT